MHWRSCCGLRDCRRLKYLLWPEDRREDRIYTIPSPAVSAMAQPECWEALEPRPTVRPSSWTSEFLAATGWCCSMWSDPDSKFGATTEPTFLSIRSRCPEDTSVSSR